MACDRCTRGRSTGPALHNTYDRYTRRVTGAHKTDAQGLSHSTCDRCSWRSARNSEGMRLPRRDDMCMLRQRMADVKD
eukprot:1161277-Pelagomonas_calceolata.AAC.3